MKRGVSQIRNAVIARVFRELDLIEQWGSGIPGVFHEAKKLNLPEPEIIEIGMRVRLTVYLAESLSVIRKEWIPATRGGVYGVSSAIILQVSPLYSLNMGI